MKTTFKKIGLSTLLTATLLTSVHSGSVGGFGGATEWTQIANNAQLANQYAKQLQEYALQAQQYQQQVQQYVNQFQSYQQMLQNIGQLPQAQWDQFSQSVQGLKQSLDFGQGLAFTAASFDTDFQNLFPGFNKYLADAQGDNAYQSFQDQYKQINTSTRDTVNGSLQALNVRAEDLKTDEQTMRQLQTLSRSAAGQKAAIQAANEIALHQTHQLKKLEQTMMIQANMQGEYIAAQNEEKDMRKAGREAFMQNQVETDSSDDVPVP